SNGTPFLWLYVQIIVDSFVTIICATINLYSMHFKLFMLSKYLFKCNISDDLYKEQLTIQSPFIAPQRY
ncbi:MAG: hypothetical protein ACE5D6_06515, partial [Candidatus Zixiibacteriota bacterium]